MKKCVIVCDNTTGLLAATLLEPHFDQVTLVDTGDHLHFQSGRPTANMTVVPARESIRAAFAAVEKILGRPLLSEAVASTPITFQGQEQKPFVGFGDSKSSAVTPLSSYNLNSIFPCLFDWDQLLAEIRSKSKAKILPYSELTSLQHNGEKITSLTINMNQVVEADHFVFLADPAALLTVLPIEFLGNRTRTRLSRAATWSRITVELFHNKSLFENSNLIFLTPNQTENEPIVGLFKKITTDQTTEQYCSTWETFVHDEKTEDPELVANVIKSVKKLVRRALPNLEEKCHEIITVEPCSYGDFSWFLESTDYAELPTNLTIYPQQFVNEPGFSRCVIAAHEVLSRILAPVVHEVSDQPTLLGEQTTQ